MLPWFPLVRKKHASRRILEEIVSKTAEYPFAQSHMTIGACYKKIRAVLP